MLAFLGTQNECISFCLKLSSRQYIKAKEFKEINLLPTKERAKQPITTKNFLKNWKGTSLFYVNELFVPFPNLNNTRSHMVLEIPLRDSNISHKSISFMAPSIWNKLSNDLKTFSLTHNYEKLVLQNLSQMNLIFIHNFYRCFYYRKLFYYHYCYYYC